MNKNIEQNLVTIAENRLKIYEAGGLAYSPKEIVSSEIVAISDISPIEHNMGVKVSSTDTTLKTMGKNLINVFDATKLQPVEYITSNGQETTANTCFVLDGLTAGKEYTISFDFKDSSNICTYLYFYGIDKTTKNLISTAVTLTTASVLHNPYTFTVKENTMYFIRRGGTYTLTQSEINKFSSFQLELGTSATPYEPYIEPTTYTPNADGTVEGVKSIYPSMTLMADTEGVNIEAEYYQDGRKVKENLKDIIVSQGGILTEDGLA